MRIFAFADAQKADFPVRTLCRVCQVSALGVLCLGGADRRRARTICGRPAVTAAHIARVHAASRRRYGSPRVTAQLAREGITVNHKAVEREIRTTRRDPSQVPAADLVRRDFARPRTDELWAPLTPEPLPVPVDVPL